MEYNFFIDESGDEGIDTGGSEWFFVGGILVHKDDDRRVASEINVLKTDFGQRHFHLPLHWQELGRNHNKKLLWINRIAQLPITIVVCGCFKGFLHDKKGFKVKQKLYNYVTRHVLERVTWLVRDTTNGQGRVNFYFSNRTNISFPELKKYIEVLKQDQSNRLESSVMGQIHLNTPRGLNNLQHADACVGSVENALEPNRFGMTDQSYIVKVREKFYRRKSNLLSYGLKLLPSDQSERLQVNNEWLRDF